MAIVLPNGIGELTGDSLVTTAKPLHSTGQVFFVSSVTGNAAFTGLSKNRPLNTLANAQTAAANGDIIVLLDGHTETYSADLVISKALTIVASGSSSGVPTVTFRSSVDDGIFTITSAGVQLRNIRFLETAVSSTAVKVQVSANSVSVIGCYFDCGANDNTAGISVANAVTNFTCRDTTFVATNTVASDPPGPGFVFEGTASEVLLVGVIFDNGAAGFFNGIAYQESGAMTRRRAEGINVLRGADVALHASSVQSYWLYGTTSGDARMTL